MNISVQWRRAQLAMIVNAILTYSTLIGYASSTATFTVKSEQDCHDLLLREISALPEREAPVTSQDTSPTDSRMTFLPRESFAL